MALRPGFLKFLRIFTLACIGVIAACIVFAVVLDKKNQAKEGDTVMIVKKDFAATQYELLDPAIDDFKNGGSERLGWMIGHDEVFYLQPGDKALCMGVKNGAMLVKMKSGKLNTKLLWVKKSSVFKSAEQ